MKKLFLFFALLPSVIFSQEKDSVYYSKMQWFADAKLGIFIHWGIYAVNGISESWSFYNGYISHEDYVKQKDGFTAEKYDPALWAKLIKESGAKYSVITSRHHDGFALWNTKLGNFNAVKNSAAKKDVLTPFMKALRNEGLKVGIYYSLSDWSHPDYTNFTNKEKRYENDPERWKKYLTYFQGQLNELSDSYNPDLFWFDGDWEHSADEWEAKKVRAMLITKNQNVILNSRLQGYGDYATPEQGMPVVKPESEFWELCLTMNDSWGYQGVDVNYKTPQQVIDIFADVISKGGNLLLDIGPKADGTIPDEQVNILKELGSWTKKHSEAIFGTRAGIYKEHFAGPSTLSKDKKMLYLFVKGNPNEEIELLGIKNKINRVYVVGEGTMLNYKLMGKVYWSEYPGITYISLPKNVQDKYMTVVAVLLDGEVDLYRK
ncbi:MAG: alpha-L-fucosidase [Bacteroidetes bacterium GWF2_38_335]|nr:MAG: alpha-L-fucosidase [Bacteroidetes bacterium GWF2_38_335]OFY78819.1 MAG: alpha-L-fucosidase [Bacteroidetes bacterium RIFOXYA12_FULL_38_20]HBS85216.1 alpha-L-fucosidase [Bacteroidales bacterium]